MVCKRYNTFFASRKTRLRTLTRAQECMKFQLWLLNVLCTQSVWNVMFFFFCFVYDLLVFSSLDQSNIHILLFSSAHATSSCYIINNNRNVQEFHSRFFVCSMGKADKKKRDDERTNENVRALRMNYALSWLRRTVRRAHWSCRTNGRIYLTFRILLFDVKNRNHF